MNRREDSGTPRPLTDLERAYLNRLLSVDFPGVNELRRQAALAQVVETSEDINGAGFILVFDTPREESAPVITRLPVSGQATDNDDHLIDFILYNNSKGGLMNLEVQTAGGFFPINGMPCPDEIKVTPNMRDSRPRPN